MKVKMYLTSILSKDKVHDQVSSYNFEFEASDELIANTYFADGLLTSTQKLIEAIESLENETKEEQSKSIESQTVPLQKKFGESQV